MAALVAALALSMTAAACGGGERPVGGAGAARTTPGAAAGTAPGADASADPERVFTDTELAGALVPRAEFARGLKAYDDGPREGWFDANPAYRPGVWSECAQQHPGPRITAYREELPEYRGSSARDAAVAWARPEDAGEPGAAPDALVIQRLISMPVRDAGRYLRLQYDLYAYCAAYDADSNGAATPVRHEVRRLGGLGDEAILVREETLGTDGTGPRYTVWARVGTVLLGVGEATGEEKAKRWAALVARRVAQRLYDMPAPPGTG
ncbi:hypothetical protein ACFVT5_31160 [Streptomyces sp. NPDC058001]|uniref:hypothetical protein n=1 Tax=Streptomyces sp. NPDC058001 TaxID=3346300 RepID=UPI0036E5459D